MPERRQEPTCNCAVLALAIALFLAPNSTCGRTTESKPFPTLAIGASVGLGGQTLSGGAADQLKFRTGNFKLGLETRIKRFIVSGVVSGIGVVTATERYAASTGYPSSAFDLKANLWLIQVGYSPIQYRRLQLTTLIGWGEVIISEWDGWYRDPHPNFDIDEQSHDFSATFRLGLRVGPYLNQKGLPRGSQHWITFETSVIPATFEGGEFDNAVLWTFVLLYRFDWVIFQ